MFKTQSEWRGVDDEMPVRRSSWRTAHDATRIAWRRRSDRSGGPKISATVKTRVWFVRWGHML